MHVRYPRLQLYFINYSIRTSDGLSGLMKILLSTLTARSFNLLFLIAQVHIIFKSTPPLRPRLICETMQPPALFLHCVVDQNHGHLPVRISILQLVSNTCIIHLREEARRSHKRDSSPKRSSVEVGITNLVSLHKPPHPVLGRTCVRHPVACKPPSATRGSLSLCLGLLARPLSG